MNILGVGISELFIILLIALVVAGPQRMARWAYLLGRYTAQFREAWKAMMETVQAEFDEAGVDIQLPKDIPTRQNLTKLASDALKPLQEPMEQAMKDFENEKKQLDEVIRQSKEDIKTEVKQLDDVIKQNVQAVNKDLEDKLEDKPNEEEHSDSFGTWSSQE